MTDEEIDAAFEWSDLHELHSYAWRAAQGQMPDVGIVLGLNLIDALKTESLDDLQASAYTRVLRDVDITGKRPQWD